MRRLSHPNVLNFIDHTEDDMNHPYFCPIFWAFLPYTATTAGVNLSAPDLSITITARSTAAKIWASFNSVTILVRHFREHFLDILGDFFCAFFSNALLAVAFFFIGVPSKRSKKCPKNVQEKCPNNVKPLSTSETVGVGLLQIWPQQQPFFLTLPPRYLSIFQHR